MATNNAHEQQRSQCRIIYKFSSFLNEDHNEEIYGCQFNSQLQSEGHIIFATVGSNRVSIYECNKRSKIKLLQAYQDPCKDEVYYCCCWTQDSNTQCSLLIAGGLRGIIRIINTSKGKCTEHFIGHGGAINDIKIHPKHAELLLSASQDHSIRLWNIDSCVCVAIFGPFNGHRDQVLCIDFHLSGEKFISGGMDHALKIWNLEEEEIVKAINKSRTFGKHSRKSFKPFRESIPLFTTREVHTNYVDCVRWYGDLVISKSCQSELVLWKPEEVASSRENSDPLSPTDKFKKDSVSIMRRFMYNDGYLWYTRFGVDEEFNVMAVGSQNGEIYIWDINVQNPFQTQKALLEHPKCRGTVRQITLTNDGSTLLCVCSDSSIWRWDRVNVAPNEGDVIIKNKKSSTYISTKQIVYAK
ncbi:Polycomb protein eed-like protein [Leptotrombidium deliense]|uniref:Polycomb protein eed-like protein n=1 Tax=Leptotrombidium deliense TaxID=299467 RepID=A0A443S985_9ACAR|nr:Polycomb protein eed-like protein [Leptotrombidium deliense]